MHKRITLIAIIFTLNFLCGSIVSAVQPPVIDPTAELDREAPLIISSVHSPTGASFIEVHNQSSIPVNLHGWILRFSTTTSEADVQLPDGWLLADNFAVVSENTAVAGTIGFPALSLPPSEPILRIELLDSNGRSFSVLHTLPSDLNTKWYQRKSTGLSGVFNTDFSAATTATRLRHTPLYLLPQTAPAIKIIEVYPHARECAPNDMSGLCGDYIKLYNPHPFPIDIGDYRLRTDSSTSVSGNAFISMHMDL